MTQLLAVGDLPDGFEYPPLFIRVVELGLTSLQPWWILGGDLLFERNAGLSTRYPARSLVPFARRQDNDDVACWDVASGNVVIIHDFSSPNHEQREAFPTFADWLRRA